MAITNQQVQQFMQDVYDMRQAQAAYFAHRVDINLRKSIAKESKVDAFLKQAAKDKFIQQAMKETPAPKLF